MSKAAAATADAAPAEAPKKKGKLLIIIAVVVTLLVVAGGAVFFLMSQGHDDEEAAAEAEAHESSKVDPSHPPVFVNLEAFTVNLRPEGNIDQYLQVVAVLRVADAKDEETLKAYMPEIRHKILILLSGKRATELSSPEGREHLADEVKVAVNGVLGGGAPAKKGDGHQGGGDGPVQSVLFTSFIIQ